jgi:hypothetical protein
MSVHPSHERRRLAGKCLVLAQQATDAAVRDSMVAMANKCLDLAERDELDNLRKSLRLRAIQNSLGQELRAHYEVPCELSHQLLTLLIQMDAPEDRRVAQPWAAPNVEPAKPPPLRKQKERHRSSEPIISATFLFCF